MSAPLFLDGEYFVASGAAVTYTWFPDRLVREALHRGLRLRSTLVMPPDERALLLRLEITPVEGEAREVEVGFLLRGGVTSSRSEWGPLPPTEPDNVVDRDEATGAVVFTAQHSDGVLVQAIAGGESTFDRRLLRTVVAVAPGATAAVDVIATMAGDRESALEHFATLAPRFEAVLAQTRDRWNRELADAFTPHNARYSGWLPELHTSESGIQRLYNTAAVGLIYMRRDNPESVHGRAWDTLMPRYWSTVTFLWDYHLSSAAHALLDPAIMRGYLERWMNVDIHRYFGTEYLGGTGVGLWYAVNDYAMVAMANDYLAWSGDIDWLRSPVAGGSARVIDTLEGYAHQWKTFRTPYGLADYGEIGNLLECVATYIHEVASLNAANVWAMRTVAELIDDDPPRASRLREEAGELLRCVMGLYADGRGFWHARYPDGSLVEVRHCYDFQTVLTTIADDLEPHQRREMAEFFFRELQTPLWMRALSAHDADAAFSVRADHQWTGAYPAWPPKAAQALFNAGEGARALQWLRGLAASANQGPFGQAHFVEQAFEPDAGGARKAPPDMPYITDWACSSSGSWLSVVIESIFGVRATVRDGITAVPQFFDFDPDAELTGIHHQGRVYDASAAGLRAQP